MRSNLEIYGDFGNLEMRSDEKIRWDRMRENEDNWEWITNLLCHAEFISASQKIDPETSSGW